MLGPGHFPALLLLRSAPSLFKRRACVRKAVGRPADSRIAVFVPFVTVRSNNVFTGYADFPLAVFYFAAVVYFIKYDP